MKIREERLKGVLAEFEIQLRNIFMQESMEFDKRDILRHKEYTVTLTGQQIIQLAYLTMEATEQLRPITWDAQNCHRACKCICADLLKVVDAEYLDMHSRLKGNTIFTPKRPCNR